MTRHLAFIGITLASMLVLCGCGNRAKTATQPSLIDKEITLCDKSLPLAISDTLQLGRMRQGEVIAQRIRLHNRCSRPIVILRDVTSCGCTTATYSREPIATGESRDITIEFNSQGQMGWQMKLMEFYVAEKVTPLKIYIDAEVE